jgi:hypothetical protein
MGPEIVFVPSAFKIDEKTIKVFHAMRCRRQFYEKLKELE